VVFGAISDRTLTYPIQNPIWKSGATPEALTVSKLATEKDLEEMISARPAMTSSSHFKVREKK
jgi:hypothetical protein